MEYLNRIATMFTLPGKKRNSTLVPDKLSQCRAEAERDHCYDLRACLYINEWTSRRKFKLRYIIRLNALTIKSL